MSSMHFMKNWSLILAISFSFFLEAQEPEQRSDTIDIIKYDVNLLVDQNIQEIDGSTKVIFRSKMNNISSISLDLQNLVIDHISKNGQPLSYNYDDTTIVVYFNTALMKDDSMEIDVYYHGKPVKDNSGWGGWYWSGDYAYNLGVAFESAPHNYGRVWHPCFDNFVERALYDISVITQGDKMGTSVGLLKDSSLQANGNIKWSWSSEIPIPSYLACIHVADYTTIEWTFNGSNRQVPIQLFSKPQDTSAFKTAFQNLNKNLEAFEHFYGPYQFEKVGYSLVPFTGGAMEHASNISYPVFSATSGTTFETLMAHELAHHWWGNWVTCDKKEEMWLNEGMASYSEYLFLEYVYGKETSREGIKDMLEDVIHMTHITDSGYRAIQGVPHEYTYSSHVYDKGALVAHTLRNYLGDSIYFPAIKQFMIDSSLRGINSASLQSYLEDYANKDLEHFFQPWVYSPGFTNFNISYWNIDNINIDGTYDVKIRVLQRLNNAPDYYNEVPLEITFFDKNWGQSTKNIFISGPCGEYDFKLNFEPALVVLDKNQKISDGCIQDSVILNGNGFRNFTRQHLKIKIDQISDSALLYIEHHYAPPEEFKTPIQGLNISQYRFWKIHGDIKGTIEGYIDFTFDGSNSSNGYMDDKLITGQEDSLVLLHRTDGLQDWNIVTNTTLYTQGSNTDKKGRIRINEITTGEYTLGFYNSTASDSNIVIPEGCPNYSGILKKNISIDLLYKVYPIPSNNQVIIESDLNTPISNIKCIDQYGRIVSIISNINNNKFTVDTNTWAEGIYHIIISSEKGEQEKMLFIEH